jgi:hypothetical protein
MEHEPRLVGIESRRLPISDGGWILVKDRLNAGENKAMVKRGSVQTADGRRVDSIDAGTAKVLAYLLDWSLKIPIRGPDATPLASAIDAIDPESYTEILRAIEAHEAAMQAERDAQKKIRGGDPTSSSPSPSPGPAASPTTGSAS